MPDRDGARQHPALLKHLLPAGVTFAEAHAAELAGLTPALLQGEEEGLAAGAGAGRSTSYRWGRALARRAMADLGRPAEPIPRGPRRQPIWPAGLVGSITHCRGYCAAAVARTTDHLAVGIDAEVLRPMRDGVLRRIATEAELAQAAGRPDAARLATALFSAKEAVYKAWFPMTQRWLGFKDAVVDLGEPPAGDYQPARFTATLVVPGPHTRMEGSYAFDGDLVVTAVTVPA